MQITENTTSTLNPQFSQNELIKSFDSFSYKFNPSEVFTDFIDYTLIVMQWWKPGRDFSYFDNKYGKLFPQFKFMIEQLGSASEGFHDALGDLFMELVSHGRNGQFFTPDNICEMMSLMTMPDLKDGQSVLDPACGSGRMLLAGGKRNRYAYFFGCDNDITCCKMATINLLFNSLQGEIAFMDSLAMDYHKSWEISYRNYKGANMPVYRVIENKEESVLWKMHMNSFQKDKIVQNQGASIPHPPTLPQNTQPKLNQQHIQLQLF